MSLSCVSSLGLVSLSLHSSEMGPETASSYVIILYCCAVAKYAIATETVVLYYDAVKRFGLFYQHMCPWRVSQTAQDRLQKQSDSVE